MKLANGFYGVVAAALSTLASGAAQADTVLITGSNQGIGLRWRRLCGERVDRHRHAPTRHHARHACRAAEEISRQGAR